MSGPPDRSGDGPIPHAVPAGAYTGGETVAADEVPPARKYVVVLFIDLVGSTALAERLDPEPLRRLLDRYYAICTSAIDGYGGSLEKFIGDAVMAVFGVPVTHEDDALRAIYAATAVQQAVAALAAEVARSGGPDLRIHSGIAAGEAVVIAQAGRDVRVVGDVVNTAARLQSVAEADEIVVSDETARAVRGDLSLEALPPLTLKGKAQPVPAWRVADLVPMVDDRLPAGFVGRQDERQQVERAFDRTIRGPQLCMVNVLGAPGIGKSRLVREFLGGLRPDQVTVLRGSCPSHGVGLTYRPLAELIGSLPGGWQDVPAMLMGAPAGEHAVRVLAAVTGHGGTDVGFGVEELAWATRLLVESLAGSGPLVLAIDDVQWAEPTFLDLLTELVTWVTDLPVLLICVARTELLESRPAWGGGVACATTLELAPLAEDETAQLVAALVHEGEVVGQEIGQAPAVLEAHDRIVAECGGNPLFATLMVEFVRDAGSAAAVPPTIRPLIEARLDRLPREERATLQRAATIGKSFTLPPLRALSGWEPAGHPAGMSDRVLRQLLRRRLIQRHDRPGEYRFESAFLRDTAYAMTSKEQRADWHLALADWMSGPGRSACPDDDELALHLESAFRLRREVRPADAGLAGLGARAARALIAAGSRAQHRRDLTAAVSLLERGRDLLPPEHPEHRTLALRVSDAWLSLGVPVNAERALATAEQATADALKGQLGRTCAIQRALIAVRSGDHSGGPDESVIGLDRHPEDDLGWCRFHHLLALRCLTEGRAGAAEVELRSALDRASATGSSYERDRVMGALCEVTQWSPTPIPDCLPVCDELARRFSDDRALLVPVQLTTARLVALSGGLEQARSTLREVDRHVTDLRMVLATAAVSQVRGLIDSLAGSHPAAADHYRGAADALRELGHRATARTLDAYAARELIRAGRTGGAVEALQGPAPPSELRGELVAIGVRARLAAAGHCDREVAALVEEALGKLGRTDDPCLAGDVYVELARAVAAVGDAERARSMAGLAIEQYTRKQAHLPARSVRNWLERMESGDG